MDPQQELFTALKLAIEAMKFDVYDGALPPEGTPYPFVYLGENSLSDIATKGAIYGEVRQTVHVWHNKSHQRGTMSQMLLVIKQVARKIRATQNFNWLMTGTNQSILQDTTTNTPLMHGVLDLTYTFS